MGLEYGDGEGVQVLMSISRLANSISIMAKYPWRQARPSAASDPVLADGVDIHLVPLEDALDHPPVALDTGEHDRAELTLSGEVHIQVGSAKERQGNLDGKWG